VGIWVNNLTKAPYLLLFALLFVGVGAASAGFMTTISGPLTADNYFDTSNIQTGTGASALGGSGNTASGDHSTVGGGDTNTASGLRSTVGGGITNLASSTVSTVGGGEGNRATKGHSTVAGGFGNNANGLRSTVGGGGSNTANGERSTVGGGEGNTASGRLSTVGGGEGNTASALRSTVAGGDVNKADGTRSTVGGGGSNTANGVGSTVGGGVVNIASGITSTIPGGSTNEASGDYSFAAGRQAKATHVGSFVWADSTGVDFTSTAPDQFSIRAAGGIRMVGDLTLESEIFCTDCIDSTDIQDGAITGSKIDGTSKLLFRECSATFTNVAPMSFGGASCQLPGLASGDNVIITNTDMSQNCMIFGGLSSSLDNLLQLKAYNGCPNTVTQTVVDFSMIIFRVN